jgi:AcrR family transcriptional regulator
MPPTATRQLSTADARREQVLAAALRVFADQGYAATSTAQVAKEAGISQAYVFKLFPTKSDLMVAAVERCHSKTYDVFAAAADKARVNGEDPLEAMGHAYVDLLMDRTTLLGQLQSFASAASHDEVRQAVRAGFERLFGLVSSATGGSDEDVRAFFAKGMLLNVLVSMGAHELDEDWARVLFDMDEDA